MTIPIVRTVDELRAALGAARRGGRQVRFVPTMGALHEGHASLMRRARADGGVVLLSIFVNPTQFGPNEDLSRYPRTPTEDLALAAAAGADLAWMPEVATLYPPGDETRVRVGASAEGLCGAFRPGHFEGVATVVTKLLVATGAEHLCLGEKDYQQTVVLKRVVQDLLLPVTVHVVPTMREGDGLALSSRNRYLSAEERATAAAIPRALAAASGVADGATVGTARAAAQAVLDAAGGLRTQYLEIRDERALAALDDALPLDAATRAHARTFIAAYVGTTRLIDNAPVRAR